MYNLLTESTSRIRHLGSTAGYHPRPLPVNSKNNYISNPEEVLPFVICYYQSNSLEIIVHLPRYLSRGRGIWGIVCVRLGLLIHYTDNNSSSVISVIPFIPVHIQLPVAHWWPSLLTSQNWPHPCFCQLLLSFFNWLHHEKSQTFYTQKTQPAFQQHFSRIYGSLSTSAVEEVEEVIISLYLPIPLH